MFQEIKKETIGLVFAVLSVAAISVTARFLDDPDAMRTLTMKTARKVSTLSNRAALKILGVADYADSLYERQRL